MYMYEVSNNKPGKMSLENIASKLTETTLSSFFLKNLVCLFFVFVCCLFSKEREKGEMELDGWRLGGGTVIRIHCVKNYFQ